jgi:hypothetical protein
MKRLPGVKDAQITLVDFAQTEVARFMRSNARTVRLSGTVFSRAREMQMDLADFIGNDPDATEITLDWVVEFVDHVVGAARGTFAMSLNTQTTLRLAVSHRLEKAMKVDHLTTNPLKAEREDFIPPLVLQPLPEGIRAALAAQEAAAQEASAAAAAAAAAVQVPAAEAAAAAAEEAAKQRRKARARARARARRRRRRALPRRQKRGGPSRRRRRCRARRTRSRRH